MGLFVKLLALWGIADSMWLATRPRQWSQFWGGTIGTIGDNPQYAKAIAGMQIAVCMWLLNRK